MLAPGGRLLLSVPIGPQAVTYFNVHRLLTPEQVCGWLDGCTLLESLAIEHECMTVWCAEFRRDG